MGWGPNPAFPQVLRCYLWPDPDPVCLQVARAGRFGTKGLAITFVSDENDAKILNDVQDRFEVNVAELPEEIDISTYSKCLGQGRGLRQRVPTPALRFTASCVLQLSRAGNHHVPRQSRAAHPELPTWSRPHAASPPLSRCHC